MTRRAAGIYICVHGSVRAREKISGSCRALDADVELVRVIAVAAAAGAAEQLLVVLLRLLLGLSCRWSPRWLMRLAL